MDIVKERRQQKRIELAEPLRGRTGVTPILICDLSSRGLRVLHAAHVARVGETLVLTIRWRDDDILLHCEVRRTEMKVMEGDPPRNVFESGLKITFAEDPQLARYQTLLDAETEKAQFKKTLSIAIPPS